MLTRSDRVRWVLAVAAMFVPALAVGVSALAWNDRLPARIASHWSGLGTADDSLPTMPVFIGALAVTSALAIAAAIVVALPRVDARASRATLFWLGLPVGIAATIWLVPAWLTLQAGSPEAAVLGGWILAFFGSVLYGLLPFAIAPRSPAEPRTSVAPLELGASEVGAWSRSITANVFIWATGVVAVVTGVIVASAIITGELGAFAFGLVVLAVALMLVASFIRLRVTIDWRGLRVTSLVFGVPLKRIPLDRIAAVEAADLRPEEWGGWGYRIRAGRSAIILRGGPGLVVTTTSGSQFALTLDDPETPAALLSALSVRRDAPAVAPGDRPHS
ncbi:hypothetical protein [Agromyces silvae]|uniref:hypothetical protein n=1 Tax=Agromyces silvae TaxID=3388266 RepID=UPI00280A6627|nr:hypothetical protein [Agromyces protaetiae]